jgi:hypothetical protein
MKALRFRDAMFLLSLFGFTQLGFAHDCDHHYHHGYAGCSNYGRCSEATGNRAGPANQRTLEGTISEVIYLAGADPEVAMVEIRLQSGGQVNLVRLAPSGYLNRGGVRIREGEPLSVRGFGVSGVDGDLTVAFDIRQGPRNLSLRDSRGRPVW